MSAITPDVSTRNSSHTSPAAPTFTPPIPPAPNAERDGEMLNYYFDAALTTNDIAEHFKLSVAVVAAWFQRPDIAALIDFITAANERRARDIARENLPGTIDILIRISQLRDNDKLSRAASSALIQFSRGRATAAVGRRAAKQTQEAVQSTASDRSRNATSSPPRGMETSDAASPLHAPTNEAFDPSPDEAKCAEFERAQTPGRLPDVPRSVPSTIPHTASGELHPGEPAPEPIALHSSPPHSVAC